MKKSSALFSGRSYFPLVFLFYLGLFIALFPDVVFYGTSFVKRDVLRFYYPVWHYGVESIKHGALPLWNPYLGYGVPFFANVQCCVLYPLTALFYLPNFLWGFNFYILLHLSLAGFFTCLWMRECGASREASFVSGLAFCLSGYVMSAISLTISLCSLVYLPLVLLALRRSFRQGRFTWKALGGMILAMQYLAGDPAVVFATLVVALFFTVYRTAERSYRQRAFFSKYVFDLTKIVSVFLCLTAVHTLMFSEFLHLTNRADPAFSQVTTWSMQYNDLLSFFFPFFSDSSLFFMSYWNRQSWLENYYVGITVIFLAVLAWRCKKTDLVGYHVLLALLGIGLALGSHSYLYQLLYDWLPFFKYIRYPIRFVFVTHFAVACLAGFGLDALLALSDDKKKALLSHGWARTISVLLAIVSCLVLLSATLGLRISDGICSSMHARLEEWTHLTWTADQVIDLFTPLLANLKRCAFFILCAGVGVLAAMQFKIRKVLLLVFFVMLVFGDLVEANVVELRMDGSVLSSTGKNIKVLLKDPGIFRAQAAPSVMRFQAQPPYLHTSLETILGMLQELLMPNLLLPLHIAYSAGYDSLYVKEVFELNTSGRDIQNPAEYRYLNMLNIKYTVSMHKELDPSYQQVSYGAPGYLYRNEKVLPRAYLVPRAEKGKSHDEILGQLITKEFDPTEKIYLDEDPPELPGGDPRVGAPSEVNILEYTAGRVRMDVSTAVAQWLFFSDTFYPGWKAFIDGKPVKIYRANYGFRAIIAPPGRYTVEWKYDPILFKIGLVVSALTVFGLAAYFARKIGAIKKEAG